MNPEHPHKRVLFVDDDQRVLSGLRRMLRKQRTEWDMAFVDNGEGALELMAQKAFDVIVSDMRMPGMDGAQLLSRVQQLHPSTVRLILSGHAEAEAAMRAVPVTHQFLSKPCDADELREVIARACKLQDTLDEPHLRSLIGGIDTLPPAPGIYRRLCALLAEEEVELDDVAALLEEDLGLTAKILQLVNSSFFGFASEVRSVRQAAAYLGTDMLRSLVLSVEVFQTGEQVAPWTCYSMEREHQHSMRVAKIAKDLAAERGAGDDAYVAALLHDVGKLVLATRIEKSYAEAAKRSLDEERPQHELEQELIGVSHALAGAYLLGVWGFSYSIVEAVAHHHRPAEVDGGELGLAGIVHVADALAHEAEEDGVTTALDLDYLASLDLLQELARWRETLEIAA